MLMSELICKKRDGFRLDKEEIDFMIRGYVSGEIPDYQMSAMCMAIFFQGMDEQETLDLTLSMMNSGDVLDLSSISGIKGDKHSTGGVGDKTSLVLCPMVAACGLKVAKMSGKGLGHTGGTIDKLHSFPGFTTEISEEQFLGNVNTVGLAIAGQTAQIDPADKKMYALRDVTGTVPSIPLIVSSIMSKKLASGGDVIILDVKIGRGAFMKTEERAYELASGLTRIGSLAGKKCAAVITDMDEPLGFAVGNSLEVEEALAVLRGESEAGNLLELCLTIGSLMLTLSGLYEDDAAARKAMLGSISDGSALAKLADMVEAQKGDRRAVYDISLLPDARYKLPVRSVCAGYVNHIEAEKVGLISLHLGGGRVTKDSEVDLAVGVMLAKKVGDRVEVGDILGYIHASDCSKAEEACKMLPDCYEFTDTPIERRPFIKKIVR